MNRILIAALAALPFLVSCSTKDPADPRFVVAEVKGTPITRADLDSEIEKLVSQLGMNLSELPETQLKVVQWQILDELVNRKVVEKSITPEVAEKVKSRVDETITEISGQFPDAATFQEQLTSRGMDEETLRREITFQISLEELLIARNPDGFSVGEEDVRKFYDENPQHWQQDERIRARHILIRLEPDASLEIQKEKKKMIDDARKRVVGGEDFEKVAGEVSEDPGSGSQGGMLPPFGRGDMVPEFEEVAFTTDPGKTSNVFKSPFGYHFLQVIDKQSSRTVPYDEVSKRISEHLTDEDKGRAGEAMMSELREEADVEIHIERPENEPGMMGMGEAPVQ